MSLHDVVHEGDVKKVERLLDSGLYIVEEKDATGWTPLIRASAKGHTEVVKLLLERNADKNASSITLFTPLIVASARGHFAIAKMLLKAKANTDALTKAGHSAASLAKRDHHHSVLLLLHKYSASGERKMYFKVNFNSSN